jgi:hypothetical protein
MPIGMPRSASCLSGVMPYPRTTRVLPCVKTGVIRIPSQIVPFSRSDSSQAKSLACFPKSNLLSGRPP